MSIITLIGIDPGLVDSGAVTFKIDTAKLALTVSAEKLVGSDPAPIEDYLKRHSTKDTLTFVEAYRDRGTSFSTHKVMREIEAALRRSQPGIVVLDNTGVKKVVSPALMRMLDCWTFSTVTNHQDLRSAARIALYGGLKNPDINDFLTKYVMKQLGK